MYDTRSRKGFFYPRQGYFLGRHRNQKFAKTSEFIVWVATVAAVLIASYMVDTFDAYDAWRFITYLSIAYMISRGLAKAGSRAPRES